MVATGSYTRHTHTHMQTHTHTHTHTYICTYITCMPKNMHMINNIYILNFSISRRQRYRRDVIKAIKHHIEEDARGPATAQKHLRDLARSQPATEKIRSQPVFEISKEGGLLDFQDVTDYGNG